MSGIRRHLLLVIAFAAFSTATALAIDIDWGNTALQNNTQSDGTTAIDDTFVFYLGWFDNEGSWPGPSSSNTAEWMDHWHPVAISAYSGLPLNRFAGTHTVSAATDPPANTIGYLFGQKRDCTAGEWILLTNANDGISGDDWLWPSPGGGGPGGLDDRTWTVNTASTVIVGQRIVTTPAPLATRFQTGSVGPTAPLPMPGELWRQLTFDDTQLLDPAISDWDADPNGNGRVNLLEFTLGTDPLATQLDQQPTPTIINMGGPDYLGLIVTKSPDAAVDLEGSVSTTLEPGSWDSGPPHVVIHSETCSEIIFRDTTPIAPGTERCLRFNATLP